MKISIFFKIFWNFRNFEFFFYSASPRSIVRVSGTTNLLFPHTKSISIYYLLPFIAYISNKIYLFSSVSSFITSSYTWVFLCVCMKEVNSIYLLTWYEGIASLLSPRLWLLTEAKPRSIVRVEGTTHLLFPNTQSISI
jgi:hypothetical protein